MNKNRKCQGRSGPALEVDLTQSECDDRAQNHGWVAPFAFWRYGCPSAQSLLAATQRLEVVRQFVCRSWGHLTTVVAPLSEDRMQSKGTVLQPLTLAL